MFPIKMGRCVKTDKTVFLDPATMNTHCHILGKTGKGKTESAVKPILTQRWLGNDPPCTSFVIDAMGGLSRDLLSWFAHPTMCTDELRSRLLYIAPSKTDTILPFNPLTFNNDDELFYNTGRAVEVIQRAWSSQDTDSMPRFKQWLTNAFLSTAAMHYPPAMAEFLLRPGTEQHEQMMRQIPERLRLVWAEVLNAGGNMKMQLLESTRNRTAPFFDCRILQLMLSQQQSRFNVEDLIRKKMIVIINLAEEEIIDAQIASTIGGLFVNEILQKARNLPPELVKPTILCLDEFQNFVGKDLLAAIPEVRQRGIELILAHQSLSQLKRGDIDLSSIIWQCSNRFMFASSAEDADIIAHELASLTFDPMKLKEELFTYRQKKIGQHIEWLQSVGHTTTRSTASDTSVSTSTSSGRSESKPDSGESGSSTTSSNESESRGRSDKEAVSSGHSVSWSQTLVDDWEEFYETSSKTYFTFTEQFQEWAKLIRKLKTGEMICEFKDDPELYLVRGEMIEVIETSELLELKAKLLEENFQQEYFISREKAERDWEELVENLRLGRTPKIIEGEAHRIENQPADSDDNEQAAKDVFR